MKYVSSPCAVGVDLCCLFRLSVNFWSGAAQAVTLLVLAAGLVQERAELLSIPEEIAQPKRA